MENKECPKLRVLCLHGHYNTAEVMKHQLAYYEHVFRDYIEFDYLTAKFEAKEVYDEKIYEKFNGGPFYSWIYFNEAKNKWEGAPESFQQTVDHLNENGPYDGVIGFSQGGYILRLIIKAEELGLPQPELKPNF